MGKMKLYDLAKELNLTSKELITIAQGLGIDVKSHLSNLEEADIKKIKSSLKKEKTQTKKENKKESKKEGKKEDKKESKTENKKIDKDKSSPVIIRKEVIIEEKKKKETDKSNNNKTPFVQRNKNADFNIVYRNRPEKPMTVSELFGLNKAKKQETSTQEETKVVDKKEETKQADNAKSEGNKSEEKNYIKTDKPQFSKDHRSKFQDKRDNKNNWNDRGSRDNKDRYNKEGRQGNNKFGDRGQKGQRYGYNKNNDFRQNNGRRPLDERGIEKNIKDIMSVDIMEKESRKSNRITDKQKNNNKFDENRIGKKKNRKNQDEDFNEGKLKNLKQRDRLSNMFEDTSEDGMLEYYDLTTQRGRKGKKKNVKDEHRTKQKIFQLKEITIPESISVKDLATELKKTAGDVIMKLMSLGIMATLNNELDFDTAFLVAEEFGVTAIKKEEVKEEDILFDESEDTEEELVERAPVVVVMGHVDHGKTSLLDTIRKTNVIEGEAGGITQAIGAYKVNVNDREITFLDTPGHEAFTSMRARGAQITDIAILVVAANDGVMPQTVEAIDHAKSANIPIIVAINKIDLPDSNPQKVKEELMKYDLVPEEWGGNTIFVEISAKKNINIDQLLEMVLLQADVLELKANPTKQSKGVVIEARLDKNKGAIASMLVQRGKLDVGDTIVVGSTIGRIRSMVNDKGKKVKSAGPSTPVEIMGLTEVPQAGDTFYEVKDEKMAKHLIERRKRQAREKSINAIESVTLDNLFSQMEKGNLKQLNLIVKADVQGSVEALKQSLQKLSNDEVIVKVIHAAAGAVTQTDVTLAKVSNAIIIAFNVRPVSGAKQEAEKNEVQIKQYSVIYQVIDDVEAAMKGMLDPKYEEEIIGTAEVRQVFKISNVGTVAGAFVLTGKIARNAGVRVIRDDVVIHEGKLISLKRYKEDVKEVSKDFECGIQIDKYNDIQEKDIIEAFMMKEIKR